MKNERLTVSELVKNRSFKNWVEGKTTPEEAAVWDSWIHESDKNQKMALEAQKRILGFSIKKKHEARAGKVWSDIDEEITRREKELPVYGRLNLVALHKSYRQSSFRQMLKIAAIILIMISGGLLWLTTMDTEVAVEHAEVVYNQITTEYGEQKEISLSDGSQIILNANSSLRYSTGFENGRRVEVELDGEAYFLVSSRNHDDFNAEEDVFNVTTGDGSVRVLGTSFTVSSRNEKTMVVLEEGKIAVVPGYGGGYEKEHILQPNELIEFSSLSSEVQRRDVNALVYTSWKDSNLYFENTPISEVIDRMEQTFGVNFEVSDSRILQRTISGTVENTDLKTMAGILEEILSVSFVVTEEAVYLR